jgi:cytochrome c-type biogenesis protein CcmH/NrfF
MIVAVVVLMIYLRRRNRAVAGEAQLSEAETRRADALLKEEK